MSDLVIAARFTRNGGDDPATGLALADINLYLTSVDRVTGATVVIWDGSQHPAFEIDNVGGYGRVYASADLQLYDYFGGAEYAGAVVLDNDWVTGSVGIDQPPIGTAKEHNYIVQTGGGVPIEGVECWYYITAAMDGKVIWYGMTDAFGQPRDAFDEKPLLDAGTYYIRRQKSGYTFDNPDTEVVS